MIQIGLSFVQAWRPQLKMASQAAFDAGDSAVADLEVAPAAPQRVARACRL